MAAFPDGIEWRPDGKLPLDVAEKQAGRPFSAYIHIPFCEVRCGYCDFNTYTKDFGPGADRATYATSILREISFSSTVLNDAGLRGRPLSSIFFGGGTPSLLEPAAISEIIEALRAAFTFEKGVEITLEANPETVTPSKIRGFAAAGVNRVSIGMQSAAVHVLAALDRIHDPLSVPAAVQAAKNAGCEVSVDLIYGTPGESLADWQTSVQAAIDMEPDHISAYSLIIEEGTKMGRALATGQIPPPDGDLDAQKYELAAQMLASAGFAWYEISNFATTEKTRSTHNLAYWRDWDWWGYGAGAHSHIGRARWWNVKHPLAYASRTAQAVSPAFAGEILNDEQRRLEKLMLGIRTVEGISVADAECADSQTLNDLVETGLIERAPLMGSLAHNRSSEANDAVQAGARIVLTLQGRLLADYVTRVLAGWENPYS